jgi:hypothetical protein
MESLQEKGENGDEKSKKTVFLFIVMIRKPELFDLPKYEYEKTLKMIGYFNYGCFEICKNLKLE